MINSPLPSPNSRVPGMSLPSWVFGSVLLLFVLCVFIFAPASLPEYKQRILAFSCALLAGLFAYFLSGDIGLRLISPKTKFGKVAVKATGGIALFVLTLWWWMSPTAPVTVTKADVNNIVKKQGEEISKNVNQHTDANTEEIKATVADEGAKTRATVQDSALSTLETMFPLAVRIPREVNGTIIKINGEPMQRVVSYDQNMKPMMLYWGDLFKYFVFAEGSRETVPEGEVYLKLGNHGDSTQLPLQLTPFTENELRIPGHGPRPMECYIYNPSGLRGFSLKVTIYSADRERGRQEFRAALLQTDLGSYARKSYLAISEDGIRLRSTASDDSSAILRVMLKDTYVKIIENQGGWARVRLPEGREGWVKKSYLIPIQ